MNKSTDTTKRERVCLVCRKTFSNSGRAICPDCQRRKTRLDSRLQRRYGERGLNNAW